MSCAHEESCLAFVMFRGRAGLCLQHVFCGTCCSGTRACPNMTTPCFRTFDPKTRTWPVLGQGGGGIISCMCADATSFGEHFEQFFCREFVDPLLRCACIAHDIADSAVNNFFVKTLWIPCCVVLA